MVHEGRYAARVEVELIETDHPWAPYITMDGMKKLDRMRLALRQSDILAALKLGEVFTMVPVAAE